MGLLRLTSSNAPSVTIKQMIVVITNGTYQFTLERKNLVVPTVEKGTMIEVT